MKQLLIATVIGFTATQAHAEAFIYACEIVVDLRFETHLAKVDEQKHTFQWRGKTYRISNQPNCAKYGWRVTGNGTSFNFCTATKGVGSFEGQPKSVADTCFGFFITHKMKTQLREGQFYGALPILYVFLARTSKTIYEVNFVRLDVQGNLQIADELDTVTRISESNRTATSSGVKIVFSDGNGPRQTLYYFSTNLADGSFQRSGFSAFLAKFGPADSLIKSASYLLHGAHFARVRELLLNRSATIVQDDSGIPLAYFDATKWRVQAFGHYSGPIPMFANFNQPRMVELFRSASPLEFGIGYSWRKNESNLLVAQNGSQLSIEEVTAQPKPDANAPVVAAPSAKKARKRVEGGGVRPLNCRIATVFPFCW